METKARDAWSVPGCYVPTAAGGLRRLTVSYSPLPPKLAIPARVARDGVRRIPTAPHNVRVLTAAPRGATPVVVRAIRVGGGR